MKLIVEVTEGYYKWLKERADNNRASVSDITILDGVVIDSPEFTSKDCEELYTKYQAFWKGVNDLAPYIADMMKQKTEMTNKETDIPRLACFDCKFAAVCEDDDYVICTIRNKKVAANDIPCFSHYKSRYTN